MKLSDVKENISVKIMSLDCFCKYKINCIWFNQEFDTSLKALNTGQSF